MRTIIALAILTTCLVAPGFVAAAATPGGAKAAGTQPIYSYATAIHQSVRVRTDRDTDRDGALDTVMVDIIRPREPAQMGKRIPVIMDASPYYRCCGRGNEFQLKSYRADGVIASLPLYYDNYFVPRGYAVIGMDLVGTNRSQGCGDYGGPAEIDSIVAVIDWLNGRAPATDLHGRPVRATWSNGSVGMIGKSYDGSLANGVAATGVDGLKTIVPISAIDSWYYYTREDGVVRRPHYVGVLIRTVARWPRVCRHITQSLDDEAEDATGAYNSFWQQRNYLAHVANVRASVFASHGVNDTNVETSNISSWWAGLGAAGVPRKLWLSQEGHVDPFDYRRAAWVAELHRWFDHWLRGISNGVMAEPAVTVERRPNEFANQAAWPESTSTDLPLGRRGLGVESGGTMSLTDHPSLSESEIVADPDDRLAGRLMFRTPAIMQDEVRISGSPHLTLRIQANRVDTPITARLIDYGPAYRPQGEGVKDASTRSCWGSSTAEDSACYIDVVHSFALRQASVISRGWVDVAYAGPSRTAHPLQPGHWRTVTVPMMAQDDTIAADHILGLAITLSDRYWTVPRSTGATVTLSLSHCHLWLPLAGDLAP